MIPARWPGQGPAAGAAAILAALSLLSGTAPAAAHDWYPGECCSGHDCFPIKETDLIHLGEAGWRVKASGEYVPQGMRRESRDGQWHLCTYDGTRTGKPRCLFEPPRGF